MAQKVLFDTDPGCDDAVMLAMALGSPAIDIVGLSTVCGNTTVENTTRNALAILEYFEAGDVPVAKGCHRPIETDLTTAEQIHGENGIRGSLSNPDTEPIDTHGADFIVEQAREHGEDLIIAAVGPLPNLAIALAKEPALPTMVDDIYVMGGAAFTVGNTTPVAEANFHNDPVAASRVVQDGAPKLVGLDVTNNATVSTDRIAAYQDTGGRKSTIADWIEYYPDEILESRESTAPPIHDAAVVADIVDDVLRFEEYHCAVETNDGPTKGANVCDKHGTLEAGPNTKVAVDIDTARYRELLHDSINTLV